MCLGALRLKSSVDKKIYDTYFSKKGYSNMLPRSIDESVKTMSPGYQGDLYNGNDLQGMHAISRTRDEKLFKKGANTNILHSRRHLEFYRKKKKKKNISRL